MSSPNRQATAPACYRVSLDVVGIWLALAVVPLLLGVIRTVVFTPAWDIVLVGCITTGTVTAWLRSYRLCVTTQHLVYQSLFTRRRTITRGMIGSHAIKIGEHRYSDRMRPFFRTEIFDNSGRLIVAINRKVFSRSCLEKLDAWLEQSSC